MVSDAPAKDPEPVTGLTAKDIIDQAFAVDPAQVYFVSTASGQDSTLPPYQSLIQLALSTGGKLIDNRGDISASVTTAIDDLNTKPYAWLNGPYIATVGQPIELDASGSYATEGEIIRYEWDLDLDGEYETVTTEPAINHTFDTEVDGLLAVRLIDSNGQVSIANTPLVVGNDGDAIPRQIDNCPDIANQSQTDYDQDGIGDGCDENPGFLEEYLLPTAQSEFKPGAALQISRTVTPIPLPPARVVQTTWQGSGLPQQSDMAQKTINRAAAPEVKSLEKNAQTSQPKVPGAVTRSDNSLWFVGSFLVAIVGSIAGGLVVRRRQN